MVFPCACFALQQEDLQSLIEEYPEFKDLNVKSRIAFTSVLQNGKATAAESEFFGKDDQRNAIRFNPSSKTKEETRNTFLHENLHFFWWQELSEKERQRWCSVFDSYNLANEQTEKSPTIYGYFSCKENFSDWATFYYYGIIPDGGVFDEELNVFDPSLKRFRNPELEQVKMLESFRSRLFKDKDRKQKVQEQTSSKFRIAEEALSLKLFKEEIKNNPPPQNSSRSFWGAFWDWFLKLF